MRHTNQTLTGRKNKIRNKDTKVVRKILEPDLYLSSYINELEELTAELSP